MNERSLGLDVILLAVFMTLKLAKLVQWSWLWVLAPIWIPIVVIGVLQGIIMVLEIANAYVQRRARRKAGLP